MLNLFNARVIMLLFLLVGMGNITLSQSRNSQLIQVLVSPNKPDWTYEKNEEISFKVSVIKHQVAIKDAEIAYKIGWEKMDPLQSGTAKLTSTNQQIGKPLKVNQPGFIRCEVTINYDGQEYRGIATAGISPELIEPTQSFPDDFSSFWTKEIEKLATIPLDPKLTLLPEMSTSTVDVYSVDFQNINKSRIYGILAKPKKAGKYPGILQVPGAGIRPYQGLVQQAEKGLVTLQIGIHGIPVTKELELYQSLSSGALSNYAYFNLDDRDQYYYKRVYLGCIRAVDFLCTLEEVDVDNLLVWGGSQGGALSIVTAALDKRIKNLVALYPAISDLTGYLHNRAGGWPHMF
ncbi:MAG: acetylxylan esterase, partial [Sphingobacterium sp.]